MSVPTESDDVGNVCDESKCTSGSIGEVFNPRGVRYDCKVVPSTSEENGDSLLCADGYKGMLVSGQNGSYEDNKCLEGSCDDQEVDHTDYYTCCPTDYDGPTPTRHCSDPKLVLTHHEMNEEDERFDPMPCDDAMPTQIYPRLMTQSAFYPDSYVCCDHLLEVGNSVENDDDEDMVPTNPIESHSSSCCFESECVSQVTRYIEGSKNSVYSCWAEGGSLFPLQCDSGLVGTKVDSEPPVWANLGSEYGYRLLHYYTCCEPDFLNGTSECIKGMPDTSKIDSNTSEYVVEPVPERHCSDPYFLDATTKPVCHDQTGNLRYLIQRNNITADGEEMVSYICCDNPLGNEEQFLKDLFEERECHPCSVFDKEYNTCQIKNSYGQLRAMVCPNPEWGRIQVISSPSSLVRYECCKPYENQQSNRPFVQDNGFKQTVYTQITFSTLALAFSLVLFLSVSYSMLSGLWIGHARPNESDIVRTRPAIAARHEYSCYNLYLVFLSIPDIILSSFILTLYVGYSNQKWSEVYGGYIVDSMYRTQRRPVDIALILACSTANTYINAIIACEILTLLRHSNKRIRYTPPDIINVTVKAFSVYVFSALIFVLRYLMEGKIAPTFQVWLYFGISTAIPMSYVCYVCFVIWSQGLLTYTMGKLRVLSLYFLRIILVFALVWFPSMILMARSRQADIKDSSFYAPVGYSVSLIFCSIQPMLSTCMAMTKPDIREAIVHFLTLPVHCFIATRHTLCRVKSDPDRDGA